MLENSDIFVNPKKRVKNFSTLNLEEVAVLKSSEDAEYIAKEFDNKKLDSLLPFSIFVGTLHLILLTGTRFIQKYLHETNK